MTTQFISRDFHGTTIRQRSSDGYLNATDMCKASGKKFKDYRRLKSTKEFLTELSDFIVKNPVGINSLTEQNQQLIQITQGGIPENQGTWAHPYVSINLAQWCSPKFAVMVTGWTFELLTKGSVTLNHPAKPKPEELAAYTKINADMLDDFGITGEDKQTALNNGLKRNFGYDALEIWDLESPASKILLIPTDIAKRVGLHNAILVNLKLIELGLQTKHRDNKKRLYYKLTEAGLKHGQYQDTGKPQKSNELARAIRWYESVLTLF